MPDPRAMRVSLRFCPSGRGFTGSRRFLGGRSFSVRVATSGFLQGTALKPLRASRRNSKNYVQGKVFRGSELQLQLRHNRRRVAPSSRAAFTASLLAAEGRFGQLPQRLSISGIFSVLLAPQEGFWTSLAQLQVASPRVQITRHTGRTECNLLKTQQTDARHSTLLVSLAKPDFGRLTPAPGVRFACARMQSQP
jgi:hypothetical protein